MKTPLQQYKGALDAQQVADGMNAAAKNAERLLADARLLANSQRYATAAAIAALSIEESGKVVILRRFLTCTNGEELKKLWREYRSHTAKNIHWILPELAAKGARKLEDFRQMVDPASDHPELLDGIKQLGFYTDCVGSGKWSMPEVVVEESLCRTLISIAEILLSKREVSVKELELWQKHLVPVWNDYPKMQDAVIAWYADMQANGLVLPGENQMEKFIRSGLSATHAARLEPDA